LEKWSEGKVTTCEHKGLFSQPMWGGKKKGCQDIVKSLNMLQEWDGEVFVWTYNMKAKIEYIGH
jgi:hypothetical protein